MAAYLPVAEDEGGRRRQIAETVFDSFAPQLDLSICPLLPPPTASSACSLARLLESCSWPPFCLGIASPAEGERTTSLQGEEIVIEIRNINTTRELGVERN